MMKTKKRDLIFGGILLFVILLLICRCFYGLGISFSDEFSQPATIKRFFQGDRVLIDDWQPATTLLGFFMYKLLFFLQEFSFSVIQLRIIYVAFQVTIATIILFAMGWDKADSRICMIAYLLSTPYGIMSICYNTVSIGAFLIFLVLFLSDYRPWKLICAGVALAFSVVAIPHVALVYSLLWLIVAFQKLLGRESGVFTLGHLKWITVGIMILFIPFCIQLLIDGAPQEYLTNLAYILGDSEHNGDNLFVKFVQSQYQIVRIYWRAWVPMLIIDVVVFLFRKRNINKSLIISLVGLITAYATIRFAFIYGSVSINLMIVPVFIWGIEGVTLIAIWRIPYIGYRYDIIGLILGWAFAVCDFLATNTEILSMSAMFIVSAIYSLRLNLKLGSVISDDKRIYNKLPMATCLVFLVSIFVLRMTFVWGDDSVFSYDTKIERNVAKGIYTTKERAEEYYKVVYAIEHAKISEDDKVLIVPINPLYYLSSDGEIATPYVFRFDTDIDEIDRYYSLHENKKPTKVLIIKGEIGEEEINQYDLYCVGNGYKNILDDDIVACYEQ